MNDNASVTTDTFNRFAVGLEPASCTPQDVSLTRRLVAGS